MFNENNYREIIKNKTGSDSLCLAKWYGGTIWLGNGGTASCHHPPPHSINVEEVKANPKAIHNTTYKKLVRKQMLENERPKECEYCWKIEDLEQHHVSDRYYKSVVYSEEKIEEVKNTPWDADFNPETIEIAFDNNCNFACSYCNASFSSKWANDVNKNGTYNNLVSDGAGAFRHNGGWAQPYGLKNQGNPFVEAFWKWWESDLKYTLKQLRITGGEATMSHDFWNLVEWFEKNESNVELAVNTNLGIKPDKLQRLIDLSHRTKFSIFTSAESFGKHSEYIRDGMEWDQWVKNLELILEKGNFSYVHIMMTINALCLGSFDKFHELVFELREKYGPKIFLSYNILRFPSFQSITTLPKHIRAERHTHLSQWYETHKHKLFDYEKPGFERTLSYILEIESGHYRSDNLENRQHDFVSFYKQYDVRRKKSFHENFGDWPQLVEWFDAIEVRSIPHSTVIGDGNANLWGKEMQDELLQRARDNNTI